MTFEPRLDAEEAAQMIAPGGGVSARWVADQMRSGALDSMRLAGRRFTTESAIKRFLDKCHAQSSRRTSGSKSDQDAAPSGKSETAQRKSQQAAVETTVTKLIRSSTNTAQANGARQQARPARRV